MVGYLPAFSVTGGPAVATPTVPVKLLLGWYVVYSAFMAIAPTDRENWLLANILPALLVAALIVTYRRFRFSPLSYLLLTVFLTLHTTGVHYTYAEAPVGVWMGQAFDLQRNHFDRVVHFCFGFLLTYPLEELFRAVTAVRGWVLSYLSVMTVLGLSALWEIIEYAVAQVVHPELGLVYVGSQGDVWDAQKDMGMAFAGSLVSVALLMLARRMRRQERAVSGPQAA
jgi:putative membrane protein